MGKYGTPRQKNAFCTAYGTILPKYGKNVCARNLLYFCRFFCRFFADFAIFAVFWRSFPPYFCRTYFAGKKVRVLKRVFLLDVPNVQDVPPIYDFKAFTCVLHLLHVTKNWLCTLGPYESYDMTKSIPRAFLLYWLTFIILHSNSFLLLQLVNSLQFASPSWVQRSIDIGFEKREYERKKRRKR